MSVRKSRSKTPQKQDRSALKNIVDPFLDWHSSLFASCLEEIKKFPDYTNLVEEWFSGDGSFEVNEETMYNILSADIKGNSKTELSGTYKILPAMPKSIAKRLKHPANTFPPSNEDSFDNDCSQAKSNSFEQDPPLIRGKLFSDDFVDTEEMCNDFKHLKIVREFMNDSEEYLQYKKSRKN